MRQFVWFFRCSVVFIPDEHNKKTPCRIGKATNAATQQEEAFVLPERSRIGSC